LVNILFFEFYQLFNMMTSRIFIPVLMVLCLGLSGIGPIDSTSDDIKVELKNELISRQDTAGAWGLGHYGGNSVETTSFALVSLCSHDSTLLPSTEDGVVFLLDSQNQDGGWGASPGLPSGIQSAYALTALKRCSGLGYPTSIGERMNQAMDTGEAFLISNQEYHPQYPPSGGWGWTPGTYDFAEPTAYGLMADPAGIDAHELSLLLESRRCADGGWDIEKRNTSRIIPTSVVLVGIRTANIPISDINGTLDLLESMTEDRNTPLSLCWANHALKSHGRDTPALEGQIRSSLGQKAKIDSSTLAICLISLEGAHG
jgi:hypothetical protein